MPIRQTLAFINNMPCLTTHMPSQLLFKLNVLDTNSFVVYNDLGSISVIFDADGFTIIDTIESMKAFLMSSVMSLMSIMSLSFVSMMYIGTTMVKCQH